MNTIHTVLYFVSSHYVTQIEPISFRITNKAHMNLLKPLNNIKMRNTNV